MAFIAGKGVMDKLQRFARRVGLGFRPDEELPVDGIQEIDSHLDQPREFRGIASLSPPLIMSKLLLALSIQLVLFVRG